MSFKYITKNVLDNSLALCCGVSNDVCWHHKYRPYEGSCDVPNYICYYHPFVPQIKAKQWKQVKVKASHIPGLGLSLVAVETIFSGDFVMEYVGIQSKTLLDYDNSYCVSVGGTIINARIMGNFARFINHSCVPNCRLQKVTIDGKWHAIVIAEQDIVPNEHLSFNYNPNGAVPFTCCCKKCINK